MTRVRRKVTAARRRSVVDTRTLSAFTAAVPGTTLAPPGSAPDLPWNSHVGTPTTLAEESAFLTSLASYTNRARVVTLGSSAQGRTIRAVIVGPSRTRDQVRAANNMLIQGCIHGDEWAGREALFEHMRNHAMGSGVESIIYIPTLNPDGFTAPSRNLANGSDPNRLWRGTGTDSQTTGGAYFPEQQCLRQAILLWRPKVIYDTHEYTSSTNTFRFDPGTTNAASTPQAVIDASQAMLTAMKASATNVGYVTANYGGAIPDDGATQAFKIGGIPSVFTETGQTAAGGLTLRRAQNLNAMDAIQAYVAANASSLATLAASATWYTGFTPTVVDA